METQKTGYSITWIPRHSKQIPSHVRIFSLHSDWNMIHNLRT